MTQIITPNLASPQFKANPYPFYARLRAEAPLYRTTLPNRQTAWLVTRYDDVLAMLQHPEQMDQLRQNPALIKPAVEELLRYCSPVD